MPERLLGRFVANPKFAKTTLDIGYGSVIPRVIMPWCGERHMMSYAGPAESSAAIEMAISSWTKDEQASVPPVKRWRAWTERDSSLKQTHYCGLCNMLVHCLMLFRPTLSRLIGALRC